MFLEILKLRKLFPTELTFYRLDLKIRGIKEFILLFISLSILN
jgi:hypothetical protein